MGTSLLGPVVPLTEILITPKERQETPVILSENNKGKPAITAQQSGYSFKYKCIVFYFYLATAGKRQITLNQKSKDIRHPSGRYLCAETYPM